MDTGKENKVVLSVERITKKFKGLVAVDNYNLQLTSGEIMGLIGPNGAGKTTVFNMLTGIFPPTEGKVILAGRDITGFRPDQIVQRGIARTFQNIRLFSDLTVLKNVIIATQIRKKYGFLSTLCSASSFAKEEKEFIGKAEKYLEVLGIEEYKDQTAKNLSYGIQRKLEIARALATNPLVLLLDEPAAGMNPQESVDLMHTIRKLKDEFNLTVILIEHDMKVVMNLCERLQVLSYGKIIAEGTPEEIRNNNMVIDAYLGRSTASA